MFATKLTLIVAGLIAAGGMTSTPAAAANTSAAPVAPTWPIPADAPSGPPPLATLPPATVTPPPAGQIGDPIRQAAVCGNWYRQDKYGDRWPAASTWWEYRCTDSTAQYHSLCAGPACDAYCPDCYWETWEWTDYFYWDGSEPVIYGQAYSDSILYDYQAYDWPPSLPSVSSDWWDAPTSRWYDLGPLLLTVSAAGTGSGEVASSPAGVSCGYSCEALFDAGTSVTLTATPDASSVFVGWTGDCAGTSVCQVTMDQTRSITATFAPNTFGLSVAKQGAGSGSVSSSPAEISCGTLCQGTFGGGTTVTLTATPDPGSVFGGWSGDCSGTGACPITMNQDRSVTATFNPNLPPRASFTLACTGLTCSFDGGGSGDPDGAIARYAWSFGDGASGSGQTATHTYARGGSYTATLTVTDNSGATTVNSENVNPISLSLRAYKQKGQQKVDLSWTGVAGSSYDVYRNGVNIVTVSATTYTDSAAKGPGGYVYRVCAVGASTCSNNASASF
jgi:uncharacterized repeat protein (TIGR02543 family)